jgi:hypothetical protein
MRRSTLVFVFALLLLSLQHQGYVHPLTHLAFDGPRETIVTNAHADDACVTCALLAGGFNAVPASVPLLAAEAPPSSLVFYSHHSRAGEVPAWFESRAPPSLL